MSVRREQQTERDPEREVRDDRDRGRLGAVVQAEESGRLQHGVDAGPARSEAMRGMDARQERDEDRERDGDVNQSEQAPSHHVAVSSNANPAA